MEERAIINRIRKLQELEQQQEELKQQIESLKEEIKKDMDSKGVEELQAGYILPGSHYKRCCRSAENITLV